MRQRGDREIDALHAFEPADDQGVVAVRSRAQTIGERRRMVQAFGGDAVERLEASCGVARVGEDVAAFAEHPRVELEQFPAQTDVGFGVLEVAVRRAAQLVRGAMLVDHPGDLARVAGEIGREARGDQQIDRLAVARREIEQPPRGRLREQFVLGLRAKGQRDELDLVAAAPEHARRATGHAAPRRP